MPRKSAAKKKEIEAKKQQALNKKLGLDSPDEASDSSSEENYDEGTEPLEGVNQDESENSDEDPDLEDEFGEADDDKWQKQFLQLLPMISKKDPTLYEKKEFFDDNIEEEGSDDGELLKPKPLSVHEYQRKVMLENEGKEVDEETELRKVREQLRDEDLSIEEQRRRAKEEFKKMAAVSDDENMNGDDDEDDDNFFSVKTKTKEQKEKEDKEFNEFYSTTGKDLVNPVMSDMDLLQKYWEAKELNDNDKFLREYVLKKRWLETDEGKYKIDQEADKDDDTHLEKLDEFEASYNFRYEEPNANQVVSFPRNIDDSVRRKEEKRKKKKEAQKKKQEEKKKVKDNEIKRLKNVKKDEIIKKLKEITSITGNDDIGIDLDEDFDPYKWDQKMNELYNDDFYNQEIDDSKAINYDEDLGQSLDFVPDEGEENEGKKTFETALKMAEKKAELRDKLDQFFNLDYEDLIGGEIPTRFKYTNVPKDDFGLSIDQILKMEEKELNQKVSLKAYAPYRKVSEVRKFVKVPAWHSKQWKSWQTYDKEGQDDENQSGGTQKRKINNDFKEQQNNKRKKQFANQQHSYDNNNNNNNYNNNKYENNNYNNNNYNNEKPKKFNKNNEKEFNNNNNNYNNSNNNNKEFNKNNDKKPFIKNNNNNYENDNKKTTETSKVAAKNSIKAEEPMETVPMETVKTETIAATTEVAAPEKKKKRRQKKKKDDDL